MDPSGRVAKAYHIIGRGNVVLDHSKTDWRMTGLGQTRSFADVGSMSGLPPEAAVELTSLDG
jgi:hypothetical protein